MIWWTVLWYELLSPACNLGKEKKGELTLSSLLHNLLVQLFFQEWIRGGQHVCGPLWAHLIKRRLVDWLFTTKTKDLMDISLHGSNGTLIPRSFVHNHG